MKLFSFVIVTLVAFSHYAKAEYCTATISQVTFSGTKDFRVLDKYVDNCYNTREAIKSNIKTLVKGEFSTSYTLKETLSRFIAPSVLKSLGTYKFTITADSSNTGSSTGVKLGEKINFVSSSGAKSTGEGAITNLANSICALNSQVGTYYLKMIVQQLTSSFPYPNKGEKSYRIRCGGGAVTEKTVVKNTFTY